MTMTKRFFLALFAISLVALSAVAEDKQAEAKFEVKSHDFGTIKEADGPVSCTFELPGKKGKIKVTFSPIGRPGAFKKTVKVKTNGKERSTTLRIEGTVIPKN